MGIALELLGAASIAQGYFATIVGLAFTFGIYWLVIQMMFAKRFKLFSFVVRRQGEVARSGEDGSTSAKVFPLGNEGEGK